MNIYTCPACNHQQADFFPRCPACGKWLEPDEIAMEDADQQMHSVAPRLPALSVTESNMEDPPRISTCFSEADRVLGGGICEGSALLFTGAPGVGKSTLLMQIAARAAAGLGPVLYISAEESLPQAAARAKRIDAAHKELYILSDNGLEEAVHELKSLNAALLIVDSLQLIRTKYCDNPPGSPAQVKEVSTRLIELAKKTGTPILVAGQIIKSGKFAGPMSVPHLYDGVFNLDELTLPGFVLLRVEKNRFGSKSEVGSFRMTAHGVEEVASPSAEILKGGGKGIIAVAMEGTKPIATEIQVGFLQRGDLSEAVVGYPKERLRLIQTILDNYGIEVPNTIALDVLGGYKISDSAADLAVAIATVHAVKSMPMPRGWSAIGEVALDGRLLPPKEFIPRYRELEILGIENCIVPHVGSDALPPSKKLKTYRARTLRDALRTIGFIISNEEPHRPREYRQTKAEPVTAKTDELENDRNRKRAMKSEKKVVIEIEKSSHSDKQDVGAQQSGAEKIVGAQHAVPEPNPVATAAPSVEPAPSSKTVTSQDESQNSNCHFERSEKSTASISREEARLEHTRVEQPQAGDGNPDHSEHASSRDDNHINNRHSRAGTRPGSGNPEIVSPDLRRLADLAQTYGTITPDMIRRNLNVGLRKAYQLHEQWLAVVKQRDSSQSERNNR